MAVVPLLVALPAVNKLKQFNNFFLVFVFLCFVDLQKECLTLVGIEPMTISSEFFVLFVCWIEQKIYKTKKTRQKNRSKPALLTSSGMEETNRYEQLFVNHLLLAVLGLEGVCGFSNPQPQRNGLRQ